ncbi:MAG: deoxyribonuclease IV [Bacillota bacterium]|jgi:deoxyribonuclease-4|nr:deoxyribonuclease IV [Bacillota bacterium]
MIKLGSHVSMKKPDYLSGSVNEALSYNANAMMIYTGAPQNSFRVPVENLKIQQARKRWLENGHSMDDLIVHAPYVINLANTAKLETFEMGKRVLRNELIRSSAIGAKYLVLHPGSSLKDTLENGIDKVVEGLNEVLKEGFDVTVCLETMAGKGSEIGYRFEHLAEIISRVDYPLGVCFDTCHTWDSGYDLNNLDQILEEFDRIIGLDKLHVLHINDSKNVVGARKDRHANIGEGNIGFDILSNVVHHPLLKGKTMILETPYIDGLPPYKEEIKKLLNRNSWGL